MFYVAVFFFFNHQLKCLRFVAMSQVVGKKKTLLKGQKSDERRHNWVSLEFFLTFKHKTSCVCKPMQRRFLSLPFIFLSQRIPQPIIDSQSSPSVCIYLYITLLPSPLLPSVFPFSILVFGFHVTPKDKRLCCDKHL